MARLALTSLVELEERRMVSNAVKTLTKDEAEELTHQIRETTEALWHLLWRAKEGKAWKALSYGTWADYVRTEFDFGRNYANKIIHQGVVIHELAAAAGVGTTVPAISEHQARQISPDALSKAQVEVKESIESGVEPEKAIKQAVEKHGKSRQARATKPKLQEAVAEVRELVWKGTPVVEALQTVVSNRGKLSKDQEKKFGDFIDRQIWSAKYVIQWMEETLHQFSPEHFVAALEPDERDKMRGGVDRAMQWLTSLRNLL